MPTYQPNIPTGTVDLDQDYLNLQANFQQLDIAYGYDHVAFSNTSGLPPTVNGQSGLHKVIHMLANSTLATNPANNYPPTAVTPVSLTGELFTTQSNDGLDTDTILWYQSASGKLSQLTRNITPSLGNNGYTYLPGGILLQWGRFNPASATTVVVTFTQPFVNNIFNIQLTYRVDDSSTIRSGVLDSPSPNKNGFTWIGNSTSSLKFIYWMAIGN